MANDMRLDLNFVDHPKVKRLIRRAGFEGFYCLVRLFSTAGKMYTDGVFNGCEKGDLDDFADWQGEGSLVDILIEVGFLDETKGRFSLHDWQEHQPWLANAESRKEQARMAAQVRWSRKTQSVISNEVIDSDNADSNADSIPTSNADSNAPLPLPLPIPIPKKENSTLNNHLSPNKNIKKSNQHGAFVKPKITDIRSYCVERKNQIDAEAFYDFYESKGWLVGKSKMRDWKAAVRNWERNRKSENGDSSLKALEEIRL